MRGSSNEVVLIVYDIDWEEEGHHSITKLNTVSIPLGFGAFHSGVQVYGKEVQYTIEGRPTTLESA